MKSSTKIAYLALFIILFLDGFGQSVIFPVLSKTLENPNSTSLVAHIAQHTRDTYFALAVGLFFLSWAFGAAVLGDLSDAVGRKKCLIICMAGMAAGSIVIGLSFVFHQIWILLVGRIIVGLTAGGQSISQATIADMTTPESQGRITGLMLLAISLGLVAGPIFGEYFSNPNFISGLNNQSPFYILAGICIAVIIMLGVSFQNIRKPTHQKVHLGNLFNTFSDAAKHPYIRKLCIAFLCMFPIWSMYYFYMNIFFAQRFGGTSQDITIYMASLGLGMSIGMGVIPGLIEKRFLAKHIFISTWTALAALVTLSFFSPSLNVDLVLSLPTGLFAGIGFVFILKVFSGLAPANKQGWIMGIFNACWITSTGIISMLTGWFSGFGLNTPLYVTGALFIVGALLMLRLKCQDV